LYTIAAFPMIGSQSYEKAQLRFFRVPVWRMHEVQHTHKLFMRWQRDKNREIQRCDMHQQPPGFPFSKILKRRKSEDWQ